MTKYTIIPSGEQILFHIGVVQTGNPIFEKKFDMGKGDRKSRKAKIWKGSYGNTRPRKRKKANAAGAASPAKAKKAAAPKKKAATKKAKAEE